LGPESREDNSWFDRPRGAIENSGEKRQLISTKEKKINHLRTMAKNDCDETERLCCQWKSDGMMAKKLMSGTM
jgi:hypothetical protein